MSDEIKKRFYLRIKPRDRPFVVNVIERYFFVHIESLCKVCIFHD